jgi:hypothetical protein
MTAGRIIVIVLVALLLFGIFAFGASYYWWRTEGTKLVLDTQAATAEGSEFRKSTDNQGCLDESLGRYHRCDDAISCNVVNNLFFLHCLKASSPVAGFCDGVPASDSVTGSIGWRVDQCDEGGLTGPHCGNFFGMVQKYCDSRSAVAE